MIRISTQTNGILTENDLISKIENHNSHDLIRKIEIDTPGIPHINLSFQKHELDNSLEELKNAILGTKNKYYFNELKQVNSLNDISYDNSSDDSDESNPEEYFDLTESYDMNEYDDVNSTFMNGSLDITDNITKKSISKRIVLEDDETVEEAYGLNAEHFYSCVAPKYNNVNVEYGSKSALLNLHNNVASEYFDNITFVLDTGSVNMYNSTKSSPLQHISFETNTTSLDETKNYHRPDNKEIDIQYNNNLYVTGENDNTSLQYPTISNSTTEYILDDVIDMDMDIHDFLENYNNDKSHKNKLDVQNTVNYSYNGAINMSNNSNTEKNSNNVSNHNDHNSPLTSLQTECQELKEKLNSIMNTLNSILTPKNVTEISHDVMNKAQIYSAKIDIADEKEFNGILSDVGIADCATA